MAEAVTIYASPFQRVMQRAQRTKAGCLEFTGAKNSHGYGHLTVSGKKVSVHRIAWVHYSGEIPDGLNVLHHCDNRPCIEETHLFLGTQGDNVADMIAKGRARPVRNPRLRLTDPEVSEIRELCSVGESPTAVARRFGVSYQHVYDIVHMRRRAGVSSC